MRKQRIGAGLVNALGVSGLLLATPVLAGEDWAKQSSHHEMKMMDANRDSTITAAEHAAGAKSMFQTMDADSDGKVTAAEMDAGHRKMMSEHGMHKESGHGDDTRGQHKGMKQKHKMSAAERIQAIDRDNDGNITAAEHERGAREMFARMDIDASGSLTADEIRSGHAKMMAEKSRE